MRLKKWRAGGCKKVTYTHSGEEDREHIRALHRGRQKMRKSRTAEIEKRVIKLHEN